MRRTLHLAAVAALCASVASLSTASASTLVDPGFENPALLTFDGAPFVGSWEGFSGGGASSAAITSTNPLSGSSSLELNVLDPSAFAGTFQDIPVAAGADVTWAGSHALGVGSVVGGSEIRIEWKDAGGGSISATPNSTPTLTADGNYVPFSLTATAPAGTAFARLVYAIQSFGAAPPQTLYLDDVSATVVPEPATATFVVLAGALAGLARRKQR